MQDKERAILDQYVKTTGDKTPSTPAAEDPNLATDLSVLPSKDIEALTASNGTRYSHTDYILTRYSHTGGRTLNVSIYSLIHVVYYSTAQLSQCL